MCQKNNFENRSIIGEDTDKNKVARFLLALGVLLWFLAIYLSHGSVVTQLRCGGILNNRFIANCIESVPVKEF